MRIGSEVKVHGNRYVWTVRAIHEDGTLELYSAALHGIICRAPASVRPRQRKGLDE